MYRNSEWYPDPTAGEALARVERTERLRQEIKGMTQKQFYHSRAWHRTRDGYIALRISIDGGLCEECHQDLGLIVHHRIWLDDNNCNNPDISLNYKHLKYDCQTCHNKEVDPRRRIPGRCEYGPNGEIIAKPDAK